jgi:hypothetical protein
MDSFRLKVWDISIFCDFFFFQLFEVCFVMISRAFFLAVLPMVPRFCIHSCINVGLLGGLGIVVGGWFCRLVISGWVLQLVFWVVSLMAFLMVWYVASSFFHDFWSFLGR